MSDLVMKEGSLFLVAGENGDIAGHGAVHGLYNKDTRYLSRLELTVEGYRPDLLSASAAANFQMSFFYQSQRAAQIEYDQGRPGTIGVERRRVIADGVLYEQVHLINYGLQPATATAELHFAADFWDLFEVRGAIRAARGTVLPPEVDQSRVVLAYRGLDELVRRTLVIAEPAPTFLDGQRSAWCLSLAPRETATVALSVAPDQMGGFPTVTHFNEALEQVKRSYVDWQQETTIVETDNLLVNRTLDRSRLDLRALLADIGSGPFPVAGIPWFAVPFGRDSLITAIQALPVNPSLAVGTLRTLATLQGQELNSARQEEPGKILHEMRSGEMAIRGEVPFLRYYGSVDATPLFLVLLGETYRWTGDLSFAASLLPHIKAALTWIHTYGDRDGDGLIEYRSDEDGLAVQSWKDSRDSMAHRNGALADSPVAVAEAQGYVYDAYYGLVPLLRDLAEAGHGAELKTLAAELAAKANSLQEKFDQAFWMSDRQFYAIALDGAKRQVGTVSSNPGHSLWSRIVPPERRAAVADVLMGDGLFSGWGVRTLDEHETTYNPMSYHNGSVWPHDNAIIALGLKRAGLGNHAALLAAALFRAANHFPYNRLPELMCGHPASEGEPVKYPVACSPQAWAAATPFMLIQAILGLEADAPHATLRLQPQLPDDIGRIHVRGLRVGDAVVDLDVTREGITPTVRSGRLNVVAL